MVLFILCSRVKFFGFCFKRVKLDVLAILSGLETHTPYLTDSLKLEEEHGSSLHGEVFYPTDKPPGPVLLEDLGARRMFGW